MLKFCNIWPKGSIYKSNRRGERPRCVGERPGYWLWPNCLWSIGCIRCARWISPWGWWGCAAECFCQPPNTTELLFLLFVVPNSGMNAFYCGFIETSLCCITFWTKFLDVFRYLIAGTNSECTSENEFNPNLGNDKVEEEGKEKRAQASIPLPSVSLLAPTIYCFTN